MEPGKRREPIEYAKRITSALTNGLLGIVLDKTLAGHLIINIDNLLSKTGLTQVIKKWVHGNIIVYYVNMDKLRKLCLYAECTNKPLYSREKCLQECIGKRYNELVNAIRKTLNDTIFI
ncbi:MAG: hypothetical protein F7C07_07500 [Desulfurococcales archaeon]|nr:hypothetical protein [Desulfurococcales archaeon]